MGSGAGNGRGGGWRKAVEGAKPPAAMVAAQVISGSLSILYKLAMNDGMDYRIIIAYRYIFAAGFITPVAYFVERKKRTEFTRYILFLSFISGLLGGSLAQNLLIASMQLTGPTYASAIANLTPCCTFLLALIFRLERLAIAKSYGRAKIVGTLTGLSGATLMTLYRGPTFTVWPANIDLLPHPHEPAHHGNNQAMGTVLGILSCLTTAFWLVVQAKLVLVYPFPYSNTSLMCWMAALQTVVYALFFKRGHQDWKLGFNLSLLAAAYAGIFSCGITFTLIGWCVKKKGPLYCSVFNPLMLITVAILGSIFLKEKLSLGCVLGSVLIMIGLYIVIWGKGKEASIYLARQMRTAPAPAEVPRDHDQSENGAAVPSPEQSNVQTAFAISAGDEEKTEADDEFASC